MKSFPIFMFLASGLDSVVGWGVHTTMLGPLVSLRTWSSIRRSRVPMGVEKPKHHSFSPPTLLVTKPNPSSISKKKENTSFGRSSDRTIRCGRLVKAGMRSKLRFVHSASGALSILLSTVRMLRSCFIARSYPIWWLWMECLAACTTSIMGLPRLKWKKGIEPARRAAFISTPVLNCALVFLGCTNYCFPSNHHGFLSMNDPMCKTAIIATWLYLAWLLKSAYVTGGNTNRKSGLHRETKFGNMIYNFSVITLGYSPMFLDFSLKAFVPSLATWHYWFCHQNDKYLWLVQDMLLNTIFLANLAALFGTAARFGIMTFRHSNMVQGTALGLTVIQTVRHFLADSVGSLIIPAPLMAIMIGILALVIVQSIGCFILEENDTAGEILDDEALDP